MSFNAKRDIFCLSCGRRVTSDRSQRVGVCGPCLRELTPAQKELYMQGKVKEALAWANTTEGTRASTTI